METWQKRALWRWPLFFGFIIGLVYLLNFKLGGSFQSIAPIRIGKWTIPTSGSFFHVLANPFVQVLSACLFLFFFLFVLWNTADHNKASISFLVTGCISSIGTLLVIGKEAVIPFSLLSFVIFGILMTILEERGSIDNEGDAFFDELLLTFAMGTLLIVPISSGFLMGIAVLIADAVVFVLSALFSKAFYREVLPFLGHLPKKIGGLGGKAKSRARSFLFTD